MFCIYIFLTTWVVNHDIKNQSNAQLTCWMGLNMQSLESCIAMDVNVEFDGFDIVIIQFDIFTERGPTIDMG
jgi:hypothetical protein